MMKYENDTEWVRRMLRPGESLLWSGSPAKGHLLRAWDAFLIPFSLFWCGFAVFWEATVIKIKAPLLFKLWGIPFVLVGLYITVGRFIHARWRNRHSRYALTDERVIVKTGKTSRSVELATLPDMSVTERSDGTGDIRFGAARSSLFHSASFAPFFSFGGNALPELRNIPDVARTVYQIRSARTQVWSGGRGAD